MEAAFDGICELVLESQAPQRMVEFYEFLGLRRLAHEGDRVWLAAGPRCRVGIWPPGEQEHRDRGGCHVHFALSAPDGQLDATVAWMRERDQDFEGPVTHDGGDRSVYLFDPEGNRVEIWDYFDGEDDGAILGRPSRPDREARLPGGGRSGVSLTRVPTPPRWRDVDQFTATHLLERALQLGVRQVAFIFESRGYRREEVAVLAEGA